MERSHINAINVTLQRFLFCVFAELVISKMLFHSECFVTQWARNIFFNVDIPVILSECFLGLELFATHITNKITNHYCEFWFLQLLWSYSDECLSQTDSKAVSWNFHFSDDRSNTLNARPLIEISGWVFFFGISKVWREENCSKYGYQNRAHPAHLLCHFLRRVLVGSASAQIREGWPTWAGTAQLKHFQLEDLAQHNQYD